MRKNASADISPSGIRTLARELRNDPKKKLGTMEIRSVYAMIAYVTYNLKFEESEVIQMICKSFDVSKIKDIRLESYEDLILYLVEFRHPSSIN